MLRSLDLQNQLLLYRPLYFKPLSLPWSLTIQFYTAKLRNLRNLKFHSTTTNLLSWKLQIAIMATDLEDSTPSALITDTFFNSSKDVSPSHSPTSPFYLHTKPNLKDRHSRPMKNSNSNHQTKFTTSQAILHLKTWSPSWTKELISSWQPDHPRHPLFTIPFTQKLMLHSAT